MTIGLAAYADQRHKKKTNVRNKVAARILCPCKNCQKWRASFIRSGICDAINKAIRECFEEEYRQIRLDIREVLGDGENPSRFQSSSRKDRERRIQQGNSGEDLSFPLPARFRRGEKS